MANSKITLATVKKFIKDNANCLFVECKSSFDGMTDCVESRNEGFIKVDQSKINLKQEHDLGIERLWFVRDSRDHFYPFNEKGFTGIKISNSCGSSVIAIKN